MNTSRTPARRRRTLVAAAPTQFGPGNVWNDALREKLRAAEGRRPVRGDACYEIGSSVQQRMANTSLSCRVVAADGRHAVARSSNTGALSADGPIVNCVATDPPRAIGVGADRRF